MILLIFKSFRSPAVWHLTCASLGYEGTSTVLQSLLNMSSTGLERVISWILSIVSVNFHLGKFEWRRLKNWNFFKFTIFQKIFKFWNVCIFFFFSLSQKFLKQAFFSKFFKKKNQKYKLCNYSPRSKIWNQLWVADTSIHIRKSLLCSIIFKFVSHQILIFLFFTMLSTLFIHQFTVLFSWNKNGKMEKILGK